MSDSHTFPFTCLQEITFIVRVYLQKMKHKGKIINFNLQMQSWAQRDNWPAQSHTGDVLEEPWPCSSATACRLHPGFSLFPFLLLLLPHCSTVVTCCWSRSISQGEAHSLLYQGLCQVAPLRIAFMITALMQAESRLLGGYLYCTDPLSGLAISSLPASKNCLP